MTAQADESRQTAETGEPSFGADRPPIAVELTAFLERQIIRRRLAPGTRLVEADLCKRYGISRSPLREALWQLEAGGLAVRRPRFGVRVAPMTLENLDHVYTCRVPLESLITADLAQQPRAERKALADALRAKLAAMQEGLDAGNPEAAFDANVGLTTLLHRSCSNPVLRQLIEQVDKPALRYRHWAYAENPGMPRRALDANKALITAIGEGQPAQAERITADLVRDAWERVRKVFAERGVPETEAETVPEDFRR